MPEQHTEQAKHEALRVYDRSLTSLEGECKTTFDGKRFVDVPELWMAAIDPFSILDRAIVAENDDPRPICGAQIFSGTDAVTLSHCILYWHHIGEHAYTLD